MTVPEPRIRAFLAAPLPGPLVRELEDLVARWRASRWSRSVRWVRPDALHLTLRFLGDVSPGQLESIQAGVAGVARTHPVASVPIQGVGPFPSTRRVRVIAMRLADDARLAALAQALESVAVDCGLAPEPRSFHPHVTLGRVRGRLAAAPTTDALDGRVVPVETVVLFRSDLESSGARHTPLARFALAAPDPTP